MQMAGLKQATPHCEPGHTRKSGRDLKKVAVRTSTTRRAPRKSLHIRASRKPRVRPRKDRQHVVRGPARCNHKIEHGYSLGCCYNILLAYMRPGTKAREKQCVRTAGRGSCLPTGAGATSDTWCSRTEATKDSYERVQKKVRTREKSRQSKQKQDNVG